MRSEFLGGSEIKWIPDGFHFLGIEEAKKRRSTLNKVHDFFQVNEFQEVLPSGYDFTSSFQNHIMNSDKKKIFKSKDNRGIEISPSLDLTLQVVKGMAGFNAEFAESNVYYIGKIIKDTEVEMGGRREYTQAGAEVIGSSHINSLIKIFHMIDGLCAHLEIPHKITLVVGNVRIVKSILDVIGFPIDSITELIPLIYSKNKVELRKVLSNYMKFPELNEFLFKLHLSFDSKVILPELKNLNTKYDLKISDIIDESEILFNESIENMSHLNLCLDCTLFRDLDYYTGFIFQAYGKGSSQPIFTGGAYDKLFEKFTGKEKRACGFALNIDIYEDIIGNE
jgi:ATP phosphoribosyltransferase regulatory subunit